MAFNVKPSKKPAPKFNAMLWLRKNGFVPVEEDRRFHRHRSGSTAKVFWLEGRRYLSLWDKDGNRVATMMQPETAVLMASLMRLTGMLPIAFRKKFKTLQNEDITPLPMNTELDDCKPKTKQNHE